MPSVLTLFVPLAAHKSLLLVVFVRALIGLFASGTFPSIFNFFRNWIPTDERTLMIPVVMSGIYVGEILSFPICGLLVEAEIPVFGGWQSCFYLFGVIGILWCPFWSFLAYEHPELHPRILKEELEHINRGKHLITIAEMDKRSRVFDHSNSHNNLPVVNEHSQDALTLSKPTLPEPTTTDVGIRKEDNNVDEETGHAYKNDSTNIQESDASVALAGDNFVELTAANLERKQSVCSHSSHNSDVSFLSDDAHAVEIAVRTPWAAFFQSMAFWTLLINDGWAAVRILIFVTSHMQ